jgi:hypothetical protein
MYNFAFYFLIFINLFQLILATNPPCKFILDEMNKFQQEFGTKFEELNEKLNKIPGGEKTMSQIFVNGMFNKKFPSEIVKVKKGIEKFLQGQLQAPFEKYFKRTNFFKFGHDYNLEPLKEHREELKNAQTHKKNLGERTSTLNNPHHSQEEKQQLELVENLINLREFTIKFIDDLIVKLHIRQPIKNFIELDDIMKEQKQRAASASFENFLAKYSEESFWKIEHIIKLEKQALRHNYEMSMLSISPRMLEIYKDWPVPLKFCKNMDKLMKAFDEANPLLEKVELDIPPRYGYMPSIVKEINKQHIQIKDFIDNVVDELPKEIHDDFFMENQEVNIFYVQFI